MLKDKHEGRTSMNGRVCVKDHCVAPPLLCVLAEPAWQALLLSCTCFKPRLRIHLACMQSPMIINLDRLMGGQGRKEKRRLPVSEARYASVCVRVCTLSSGTHGCLFGTNQCESSHSSEQVASWYWRGT